MECNPSLADHTAYDPFAITCLHLFAPLFKFPVAWHQQTFDGLILYGAASHGAVCPGPLVRINKLRIPGRWQRLYLPPLGTHLPRW